MSEMPQRIGALPTDGIDAPDLAPFSDEETRGTSMLDDLNAALDAALSADVVKEDVTLPVPLRPGLTVRFSTDVDDEKMKGWRARSQDSTRGAGKGDVDAIRWSSLIVATQAQAFLMGGKEVHDTSGQTYTFGHAQIRAKYGAQTAVQAVSAVYSSDPHIMIVANEILERAGFGDQVVPVEGEASP